MTATDTAETMRHLEETTTAAMVGWAKAATEVERLTAERDEARAELERLKEPPSVELPNDRDGVVKAWFRTYLQWRYQAGRADKAEAALDRVRTLANKLASLAPEDDWGDDMPSTVGADVGRQFIAALDGSGT